MKKLKLKHILALTLATSISLQYNIGCIYGMTDGDTTDAIFKTQFYGVDDYVTSSRRKNNATPVYIKNTNSTYAINVGTCVKGTNKESMMHQCKIGEEIFIKSRGAWGDYVFLRVNMNNPGWIKGKWSPDSIGYKNVLK